jgi:hypothetical protein
VISAAAKQRLPRDWQKASMFPRNTISPEYISELEEIGLDEVLYQDAVVAIEWADKLPEGRLAHHLVFQFKIISDKSRQIDIFAYGHAESNLLKAVEKRIHHEFRGK